MVGGPWGPPSRRHLTGEDESLAPTHCLDKRVIACLRGAVWLAYIHNLFNNNGSGAGKVQCPKFVVYVVVKLAAQSLPTRQ